MSGCNGSCGRGTACPTNIKFITTLVALPTCRYVFGENSVVLCGIAIAGTALLASNLYKHFKNSFQDKYTPLISQTYNFTYEGAKIISQENLKNHIVADENGSHIWSKGLSYIELDKGADNLYFSLCSTKIIDRQVTTIENFNPEQDKLWFFCTKKQVETSEITIYHKMLESKEYTCLEIRDTAVCLAGDISLSANNIISTDKAYVESAFDLIA